MDRFPLDIWLWGRFNGEVEFNDPMKLACIRRLLKFCHRRRNVAVEFNEFFRHSFFRYLKERLPLHFLGLCIATGESLGTKSPLSPCPRQGDIVRF
jgi:hypothetical protein